MSNKLQKWEVKVRYELQVGYQSPVRKLHNQGATSNLVLNSNFRGSRKKNNEMWFIQQEISQLFDSHKVTRLRVNIYLTFPPKVFILNFTASLWNFCLKGYDDEQVTFQCDYCYHRKFSERACWYTSLLGFLMTRYFKLSLSKNRTISLRERPIRTLGKECETCQECQHDEIAA